MSLGAQRVQDDAVHAAALLEVLARGQVRRLVLLVLLDLGLREAVLGVEVLRVEDARPELVLGRAGLPLVLLRRVGLPLVPLLDVAGRGVLHSEFLRRLTLREVLAALFKIGLTRGELRIFSGKVI